MVVVFSPDGRGVFRNINNDGDGVFPITSVLAEAHFSSKNGDGENPINAHSTFVIYLPL